MSIIKKILHIVGLSLLLLFASVTVWTQSLDYEVETHNGNWVSLEELKGEKLTVIDFWASWCKPCMKALPELEKLHQQFKDKGVVFIGVNTDSPRNLSKIAPIVNSLNLSYTIVKDPNQDVMLEFNVQSCATLIILDEKGKRIDRHIGFKIGDEKILAQKIKKQIAQ